VEREHQLTQSLVPAGFAEQIARREGAPGRAWLDSLPGLIRHFCHEWALTVDGPARHGYVGIVLPVTRADDTAVLKLSWQDEETFDESLALSTWDGQGSVLLLESDPSGVMLLERLDARRTLDDEPIGFAVETASRLLRRLSVPTPGLRRTMRTEAARWAEQLPETWNRLGRPLPRTTLDLTVDLCRKLGPEAGSALVNEDLHYRNVLAGTREPWLAIDPKPITGDLEFAVIPLLWNRIEESAIAERFSAIVAAAELDAGLAREWTLVRAVVNHLWAVGQDDDGFAASLLEIVRWVT
jgi:streptomycin 6-kinase